MQELAFKARVKQSHLKDIPIRCTPEMPGRGRHFHDRQIFARVMKGNPGQSLRWDVSSGIDSLMDASKEAVLYACEL